MIQVDEKLVQHLARLSRIACPQDKLPAMVKDLEKIVAYFEELEKVPTDDVEGISYVSQFVTQAPLREDEPINTIPQKIFLDGTEQVAQLVRTPNVIKDS